MKTELEKCLAGEPFRGGDRELVEITARAKRLTRELNNTDYTDTERKRSIMQQLFGSVGRRVHLDIDFHCEYGRNIFIGDRVIINMNCTFVDNNIIEIGNDVLIASNVQIYTATHSTKYAERIIPDDGSNDCEFCLTYAKPVKICDGAWLGGGVVVLPGHRRRQRGHPFGARQLRGRGQSVQGDKENRQRGKNNARATIKPSKHGKHTFDAFQRFRLLPFKQR